MAETIELGFVPWEAQEMDRWLKEGNATLGWRGDPRLELRIGVITTNRAGVDPHTKRYQRKGDKVAWRWEVWRNCEDGTEQRILQRKAEEIVDIIPSLITQDPRTPGFEPVMDTVTREHDAAHKERATAIGEAIGEKQEHLWKLVGDSQNGRTTFRGLPGRNPDKQM